MTPMVARCSASNLNSFSTLRKPARRHYSGENFGMRLPGLCMKILYLENHAIFAQQVISQFLKSHQVTVVATLAAARQTLASENFDLVLSDYDLDDGKGDEFVRECRAAHPRLPIIAVSSHEAGNAALMRAGASAVCSKMGFQRIEEVIRQLMS
jgi:DNA-binding NarL/FixJ family response regulator